MKNKSFLNYKVGKLQLNGKSKVLFGKDVKMAKIKKLKKRKIKNKTFKIEK